MTQKFTQFDILRDFQELCPRPIIYVDRDMIDIYKAQNPGWDDISAMDDIVHQQAEAKGLLIEDVALNEMFRCLSHACRVGGGSHFRFASPYDIFENDTYSFVLVDKGKKGYASSILDPEDVAYFVNRADSKADIKNDVQAIACHLSTDFTARSFFPDLKETDFLHFIVAHELSHAIDPMFIAQAHDACRLTDDEKNANHLLHRAEFFADMLATLYLKSKGVDISLEVSQMRSLKAGMVKDKSYSSGQGYYPYVNGHIYGVLKKEKPQIEGAPLAALVNVALTYTAQYAHNFDRFVALNGALGAQSDVKTRLMPFARTRGLVHA